MKNRKSVYERMSEFKKYEYASRVVRGEIQLHQMRDLLKDDFDNWYNNYYIDIKDLNSTLKFLIYHYEATQMYYQNSYIVSQIEAAELKFSQAYARVTSKVKEFVSRVKELKNLVNERLKVAREITKDITNKVANAFTYELDLSGKVKAQIVQNMIDRLNKNPTVVSETARRTNTEILLKYGKVERTYTPYSNIEIKSESTTDYTIPQEITNSFIIGSFLRC